MQGQDRKKASIYAVSRYYYSDIPSVESRECRLKANRSQIKAWKTSFECMHAELRKINDDYPGLHIFFEYGIRYDSYKRPDALLICKEAVIILEFKDYEYSPSNTVECTQVLGYAGRFRNNHKKTKDYCQKVIPILVYTKSEGINITYKEDNSLTICSKDCLGLALNDAILTILGGKVTALTNAELHAWKTSDYIRNIDLLREARHAFITKDLVRIKVPNHAYFPDDELRKIIEYSKTNKKHTVVFISGVPGGGKTYLGLKYVFEEREDKTIYLSGNGPLVKVLKSEIGLRECKDSIVMVHAFLKDYLHNRNKSAYASNIVVFDEGQRIWNAQAMAEKYNTDKDKYVDGKNESEAYIILELLLKCCDWAVLIVLVGDSQEIYKGETIGLKEWEDALKLHKKWEVISHPENASELRNAKKYSGPAIDAEKLKLCKFERANNAEKVGDLVNFIMSNKATKAKELIREIKENNQYFMYYTHDLEDAKAFCYNNLNETAQYGCICSSRGYTCDGNKINQAPKFSQNKTNGDNQEIDYARWYDGEGNGDKVCRGFKLPIDEFGCQGLELDVPILLWHSDMLRKDGKWEIKHLPYDVPDEQTAKWYRLNSYRVLLTRGRRGIIIYIPRITKYKEVYSYFNELGIEQLPNQPRRSE